LDLAAAEREAIALLEGLCRLPSVSAEGGALLETAEHVEELLRGAGFETRQLRVDGGPPAVWGELQGTSDRTVLLYNHYDVQPPDPLELWETPPFEPSIRDGKLFARGAADNKAQIALRLAALRALDGPPPLTIRWIVEGEEEVASPHFDAIVRANVELLRADGCLWEGDCFRPDGRPEVMLGVKGVLSVRLDLALLSGDAHSGAAAVVPSAPWRLIDALTRLRDPAGRVRVEGFYDPVRGPTAAELEAVAAQSPTADEEFREAYGVREFLDGVSGAELRRRLSFEPTCNLAGFHSGYGGPGVKTVLPARASAWIDFRLVPDQHPDEVEEQVRAQLDRHGFGDVEVTRLAAAEPALIPLDDPFAARAIAVAERIAGKPASIVPSAAGTLPIVAPLQRHVGLRGLSVPDNAVYNGTAAHAPNEHIRLQDLAPAMRYFVALLEELALDR
jgi:acetylornithine deacetylase/succinyl-diaminopimelate desuccinylase-like protein